MFVRCNRSFIAVSFVIAAGLFFLLVLKTGPTDIGPVKVYAASLPDAADDTPMFVTGVTIQSFSFTPSTLNITAGTTVRWTWAGGTHSTTSGNCCTTDGLWNSGTKSTVGSIFDRTFSTPGTFNYYCQVHGAMMTGQIIVTAAATATISGRVLTTGGRGIKRAVVTLTDSSNVARTFTTNNLGAYQFANVTTGQTYVISVQARRFSFTPQSIAVTGDITNQDLVCQSP